MQSVGFGEHLELGQLADEPHGFIFGFDVDLVLLTNLKQAGIRFTKIISYRRSKLRLWKSKL